MTKTQGVSPSRGRPASTIVLAMSKDNRKTAHGNKIFYEDASSQTDCNEQSEKSGFERFKIGNGFLFQIPDEPSGAEENKKIADGCRARKFSDGGAEFYRLQHAEQIDDGDE